MTLDTHKLYGLAAPSLLEAKDMLSQAVAVDFSLHDSMYRGGDYYLWVGVDSQEMILQPNFRDEDGVLAEPSFPQYSFVLYTTDIDSETHKALASSGVVKLLRSES